MNNPPANHLPSSSCLHPFEEGIRLFNDGAFWHAHEQWEVCWRASVEPEATFYKGIIQTAAALVHWQRGNLRGLRRNWFKARPKLVALPAAMHGIDLRALIATMDGFVLADGRHGAVPRLRCRPADPSGRAPC
jgi:predicted metal-dependent hydrolase